MTSALSAKVEVPGVRPATLRLVERGPESFFVYRSSRKIGTARVEPKGAWTARFDDSGLAREASAKSGPDLLQLVGQWLLLHEARDNAARPLAESRPDLPKGRKTVEEKLSLDILRRARERRLEMLKEQIKGLETQVRSRRKFAS